MTWTREHDRVIAEKCEGLRVLEYNGEPLVEIVPGTWRPLYNYSAYLPDTVRAAEAWRKGDIGMRTWLIESPHNYQEESHSIVQQGYSPDAVFHGYGPTPAAALAHALYQAVTG
jgi:hypothetical protein